MEFCNILIDTNDQLLDVIFTDETSVQLHQNGNVSYRKKDAARLMRPKPKHPLNVYGAISRRGLMDNWSFSKGIWMQSFSPQSC